MKAAITKTWDLPSINGIRYSAGAPPSGRPNFAVEYRSNGTGDFDYGRLTTLPDGFGDGEFTLVLFVKLTSGPTGQTSTGSGIYTNWANENAALYDGAGWWYYGNFLIDGHNNATLESGTFSLQIYNSGQAVRWTFSDGAAAGARVGDLHGIQGNAPATLLDDEWHIISCVRRWDGGTGSILELWVDGTLVDSETSTSRTNMATTYWDSWSNMESAGTGQSGWFFGAEKFAALTGPDWSDFKGRIADVGFFNRALSSGELTALTSLNGNESGLVGFYRHTEGSGAFVQDELASGGDISLINSPSSFWVADSPY